MYLRKQIGSWLFAFYARRIVRTGGFNSNLTGGEHALFFDFDAATLRQVETELRHVQDKYSLPTIYLLSTGRPDSWHAYCFRRCTLRDALRIILDCPSIDLNFIGFAGYRKHFTIRLAPKNGRMVEIVERLYSPHLVDCSVQELDSFTFYQTGANIHG